MKANTKNSSVVADFLSDKINDIVDERRKSYYEKNGNKQEYSQVWSKFTGFCASLKEHLAVDIAEALKPYLGDISDLEGIKAEIRRIQEERRDMERGRANELGRALADAKIELSITQNKIKEAEAQLAELQKYSDPNLREAMRVYKEITAPDSNYKADKPEIRERKLAAASNIVSAFLKGQTAEGQEKQNNQ